MTKAIVGIEGTSLTGKTTLANRLQARYPDSAIIDCYYEWSACQPGRPDLEPVDREAQLAALQYYLDVELERVAVLGELVNTSLVLVDRTADTLLAHTAALDALHGLGIMPDARSMVSSATVIQPDLTLHLVVNATELARRAQIRPGFPRLLYEPDFVALFDAHFTCSVAARCYSIDGTLAPQLVEAEGARLIERLK